ncbi:MAG: NAD(P)-dependent oxidoreductase [Streptosporangiaceae bacterium]
MRLLFGGERYTAELSWTDLAPLLPGWEIISCPPAAVPEHLAGVDAICPVGARIDADVLEAGSFGIVHQFGVGLDRVDVARAGELGVWVARVPGDQGGNADSVAELTILLLLALMRKLDQARAALRERRWSARPAGRSLAGSTLLLVGLGAIGTAVARRLAPFGARLLGVRAHPQAGGPPEVERVWGAAELAEALPLADAVICCAMFDGSNARMFDASAFGAMRPGALFVNVARGGLVDEAALLAALDSGQVGGAGLDVHAREPADPGSALLRHPAVVATPHVGGLTETMFRRTGEAFAANILRWADGSAPRWAVNEPARPRRAAVP